MGSRNSAWGRSPRHGAAEPDAANMSASWTALAAEGVTAPTLILSGDRDPFVSLEETVALLRLLEEAEGAQLGGEATVGS